MNHHLITLMVILPLLGALLQAFIPAESRGKGHGAGIAKQVALGASLAASLCALAVLAAMHTGIADLQAHEILPWVGSYSISYDMGIDGLNAPLVLLIAILFPVLIAAEWNQKSGARGMHALFLVLQASLFGSVCAQDLFLMFFFWGLSALPFYFLIGIWGGENREQAAFRSIVAACLGNALLFGALVLVYYAVDPHTFSLKALMGGSLSGKTFPFLGQEISVPAAAFGLVCGGLALRAPIWPFHGWFTQVAEEAPPAVFVALSAAAVPVAASIFCRLAYTLFPGTVSLWADAIVAIGAINLLVGGTCAVAQKDLRRLLAFICLSEVGLILMGVGSLNAAGAVGAVYQELAIGLGMAGFGLFAGLVVERAGRADFVTEEGRSGFGGIAPQAPLLAAVVGIVVASLLGFPGASGFVGRSLLVLGSYSSHPVAVIFVAISYLLATFYLFSMYRHVFLGKGGKNAEGREFRDLNLRERAYLLPIVGALLVFGVYPKPLLEVVRPTVLTLLSMIH